MTIVAVTGASAGVGRASVREFARRGCDVALIARGRDRLEAAAQELRLAAVARFGLGRGPNAISASRAGNDQDRGA